MSSSSTLFPHLGFRVAYDGIPFQGFQHQENANSIQQKIEEALSILFPEFGKIRIQFTSRTDAGVSAYDQWVILRNGVRALEAWPKEKQMRFMVSLNALLKPHISVWEVLKIRKDFEPQKHIEWKEYHYRVLVGVASDPCDLERSLWVRTPLNLNAIRKALKILEGTHDFSSFARRAKKANVRSFKRKLLKAQLQVRAHPRMASTQILTFIFRGTGFLQHQCRAMVGTLIEKGRGFDADFTAILAMKDRKSAGQSRSASPLILFETRVKAVYFKKNILHRRK